MGACSFQVVESARQQLRGFVGRRRARRALAELAKATTEAGRTAEKAVIAALRLRVRSERVADAEKQGFRSAPNSFE